VFVGVPFVDLIIRMISSKMKEDKTDVRGNLTKTIKSKHE